MYCFHDKIRIYFMSFIVQISPFVHLFTLKIVFRWPGPAGSLKRSSDPSPQVVPTFHFIPSYAPDKHLWNKSTDKHLTWQFTYTKIVLTCMFSSTENKTKSNSLFFSIENCATKFHSGRWNFIHFITDNKHNYIR